MRSSVVIVINAGVVLALGLALLVPLALSLLYQDGSWESFLIPAALMIPLGAASLRADRLRGVGYVLERDVYLSVTLAWTLAALLGGAPFLIEGTFLNPLDSTFEAMSGFTTTGATLLSDIEGQTPSILFWRSMTHWLGGIGIVMLFVAVAPLLGVGAARLLGAEVSGLTQPRLTPRIADTAKALVVIYLAISAAETLALLAAGMPLYDSVVHTFGTVATGGFSHKTASIGFYDSVAIEAIIIFFMTASGSPSRSTTCSTLSAGSTRFSIASCSPTLASSRGPYSSFGACWSSRGATETRRARRSGTRRSRSRASSRLRGS
jgi:trk system potassium uptake protein TrkH